MVSPIFLSAQSLQLTVSNTALYCLNKNTNSFLVFDDSTFYYSKLAAAKKWEKHPFIFKGDNISFNKFKTSFRPITLSNGRLFFVYEAIGEVYALTNDTLQRIDHSFKHENQYFHSLFEHNNRIYAFGGYGLFTFKNILTYFDENLKEWFEVPTPIKPTIRGSQFFQYNKGILYVFAGGFSDGLQNFHRQDCWAYHFDTKKWKKVGDINSRIFFLYLSGGATKEHLPYEISFNYPNLQLLDIKNNKVLFYENKKIQAIRQAIFDKNKKNALLERQKADSIQLYTVEFSPFLKNKLREIDFLKNNSQKESVHYLLIFGLVILALASLFFGYLFAKKKRIVLKNEQLTIRINNDQVYIGSRSINNDLTLLEFRILSKFIELKGKPIDIIALNELFEDETTSLAAQKKRRETTLKSLREKLAFFLNVPQELIFLESRDLSDKRIKKFVINPDILAK